MSHSKTVLILCTGNSCRSQMAQALINHDLGPAIKAISAGTSPGPKVATGAIEALKLAGISTEGLYPKNVDAVMNDAIDLVVTVCDNAKETCPIFPKPVPSIHMPFHDPHGEPLESFLQVRDEIRSRLLTELKRRFAL
jgi:arsenate reductase